MKPPKKMKSEVTTELGPSTTLYGVKVFAPEDAMELSNTGLSWCGCLGIWTGNIDEPVFDEKVEGTYEYEFPDM